MKIVSVTVSNVMSQHLYFQHQIATVEKITPKTIIMQGNIDYHGRFDRGSLDKLIYSTDKRGNNHLTTSLDIQWVTLCEDDNVKATIKRLEAKLYLAGLEELKRRRSEIDVLEIDLNNLMK